MDSKNFSFFKMVNLLLIIISIMSPLFSIFHHDHHDHHRDHHCDHHHHEHDHHPAHDHDHHDHHHDHLHRRSLNSQDMISHHLHKLRIDREPKRYFIFNISYFIFLMVGHPKVYSRKDPNYLVISCPPKWWYWTSGLSSEPTPFWNLPDQKQFSKQTPFWNLPGQKQFLKQASISQFEPPSICIGFIFWWSGTKNTFSKYIF